MKNLRKAQYITIAIMVTVLFEGMVTLGSAFRFEDYNWFAWFMQSVIFAFAIITALRVADEVSEGGQ
jgi:hypothetical protein